MVCNAIKKKKNCSQPLEHCSKKQLTEETHSVPETGLVKLNSSYQNSIATPNDSLVAAILAVADDTALNFQTHHKPTETF